MRSVLTDRLSSGIVANMSEPALDSDPQESPRATCALCGVALIREPQLVNGQPACPSCVEKVKEELAAEQATTMSYLPAIAGGLAGAIAGAVVWAGVAVATDLEVGYIAVLVGFLAGWGVKYAARGKRGQGLQLAAAGLSIVGLVVAKLFIVQWFLVKGAQQEGYDVSLFDTRTLPILFEVLPKTLSAFDVLWLLLAIGAAYRVPAASKVQVHEG